jgi:hypothetical protein
MSNSYTPLKPQDRPAQHDANKLPLNLKSKILIGSTAIQMVFAIVFIATFEQRGLFVLYINPFFIVAAVIGFFGALKQSKTALLLYIWGSMGVSFVFIGFSVTFYFAVDRAIDYLALHLPFSAFVIFSSVIGIMTYRDIPEDEEVNPIVPVVVHEPEVVSVSIEGTSCVVCLDEPRTAFLYPCGHNCVCLDCGAKLKAQDQKCPICRTKIQDSVKVFK